MSLTEKVKTALEETRLLILGAQVLFGFGLQGVFRNQFVDLARGTRAVDAVALVLMALTIGLLIAPSLQHRIVEEGHDTARIQRVTTLFAGLALLPFAISLGLSVYVVVDHVFGRAAAWIGGTVLCVLAALLWCVLGFVVKARVRMKPTAEEESATPLSTRVEQMLTEARVILPGAQALLGFQFTVMLTRAFAQLPSAVKLLHMGALCCVAVAVILLMTPAALHRIAFAGNNTQQFFRMASAFVIAAPAPLALGIAADVCVAVGHAAESYAVGAGVASGMLAVLAALWYALPIAVRARRGRPGAPARAPAR